MRKRIVWVLAFVLLACGLWWLWQRPAPRTGQAQQESAASSPAPTHASKVPPKQEAAPPREERPAPPPPQPAKPDELVEWMDSLVTLCLRREKPQARALYTQLLAYRPGLADLAKARYEQVIASQAQTPIEQDAKLTALAYLALLRPREDFMELLEPLRKVWQRPLADEARKSSWAAVEKKYLTTTADEALIEEDRILANVVAFVVGEHLRAGDVESLQYVSTCLQKVAPGEAGTELPDPWLSAILTHCGKERGLPPETTKTIFENYAKTVAEEYSYTLRLRHQAKLLIVNDARSVFELLGLIGNSLSGMDAAKAVVDYLQRNDIDAATWQMIVEALVAKYGWVDLNLMISLALQNFRRLGDADYAHALAATMLESASKCQDPTLCLVQLDALCSLVPAFRGQWRGANPGKDPPKLLEASGSELRKALPRLNEQLAKIVKSRGWVVGGVFADKLCNLIFESCDPLRIKLQCITALLDPLEELPTHLVATTAGRLKECETGELLANSADVVALVNALLTKKEAAPAKPSKNDSGTHESTDAFPPALALSSLNHVLKTLGYPALLPQAVERLGKYVAIIRGADAAKVKRDGYIRRAINEAEKAVGELTQAGYPISK